jgi:membrane-associated phospholipid phosphatase
LNPGVRLLGIRLLPAVAYAAIAVLLGLRHGLPVADDMLVVWIVLGLACASIASGRRRLGQLVVDWLPLAAVLTGYDLSRGVAGGRVPIQGSDEVWVAHHVFGTVPSVWLQQHLWNPNHIHWYDLATWGVYTSYFFATFVVLTVLWLRDHAAFRRYVALLVAIWVVGLCFFTAFPTIPPWLARQKGMIGPVERLIGPIGTTLPAFLDPTPVWERGVRLGNDLAAFPSMHEAMTVLISVFFWGRTRRAWLRAVLVAYPLAMAFALVYTGEHYVLDLAAGAGLVLAVVAADRKLKPVLAPKLRLATLLAWTLQR